MRIDETTTSTPTITKRELKVQDANRTIPFRLVGSYEYGKAVVSFAQLLKISTPEEISVYDIILNERPEFTYFNGVNAAFGTRPNLAKADEIERTKFYDAFQKKGLCWMVALARIELGATMSMYGSSKAPFEDVLNGHFDMEATMMVLSDDVVAHMKSLAQEEGFKKVVKRGRKIDTWTLAYLRRLKLIRDMLSTLGKYGNNAVKAKIQPFSKELAKYENRLLDEIEEQTKPETFRGTDVSKRTSSTRTNRRVSNQAIEDCANIASSGPTPSGSGNGGHGNPNEAQRGSTRSD